MPTFDPEKERQRLAEHYAGMHEGELRELAAEAGSLTEAARKALKLELSRRGLTDAPQDAAAPSTLPQRAVAPLDQAHSSGPITLCRFRDLPEALLAKTILDSADIECYLIDENTIRIDWLWSNALGGIKLWVRQEDADAGDLLDQDYLEAFHVEGVGGYRQPRCPNCQSFDVSFQELIKRLAYRGIFLGWFLGLPAMILLRRGGWICHSCGHAWEGANESPEQAP